MRSLENQVRAKPPGVLVRVEGFGGRKDRDCRVQCAPATVPDPGHKSEPSKELRGKQNPPHVTDGEMESQHA